MANKDAIQKFDRIFLKDNAFDEITLGRTKSLERSVEFESEHSKLPKSLETIKKRFIDDIFHYWNKEKNERCRRLSPREWVANLTDNLEELNEFLGAETLQSILPDRVFTIEEKGSFYPHEQWMIQSVKTMKDEMATITELWIELHFEPKTKWTEIIAQYKEVFHLKLKENHSLHFCHVISSIKEFTIAIKKLYDENKVKELWYISGFGRDNSRGNFPEPTWKEICDWARANLSTNDLANFEPNLDFASVDFEPASSFDIMKLKNKIGKKELGYGNLRDYLWNKKVIARRNCSAILKNWIGAADPILRLEDAAFNIVSKHFPNKSPEELNNLVKQSSILNFFDFDNGLVASFQRNGQEVFLKMIFDIDKREFAKWVALKIQLDPRHLLMRLRQMEIVCAKHVNPKTANYYRFPSINKCRKCELKNKDCWCPKPFTEEYIHPIVLRYLANTPFFKTAFSGVTHLIKHYFERAERGELYLDRLEMLRGYRLEHHIAKYISLVRQLVSSEPKTGNSLAWLESQKKNFTYIFSSSGSISVFSVQKGVQDEIFFALAITEFEDIFLKTLYQAGTYGVQNE